MLLRSRKFLVSLLKARSLEPFEIVYYDPTFSLCPIPLQWMPTLFSVPQATAGPNATIGRSRRRWVALEQTSVSTLLPRVGAAAQIILRLHRPNIGVQFRSMALAAVTCRWNTPTESTDC